MTQLRTLNRPWIRAVVGIGVSAVFVAITLSRVDLDLMAEAWAAVGYAWLGVALLVSVIEVMVRAARWNTLLRPFATISFGSALGFLSVGHLANAILPARLGDVARALITGRQTDSSRASVLGTIAVERIADAGLLGIATAAGVLVGYGELAPAVVALAIAGLLAAAVTTALALVLGRQAVAATRVGAMLLHHGRRFVAGVAALRTPSLVARVAGLTIVSFGLAVTVMYIVTAAVGLDVPLWQAALVMAAVTLSTAIPAGPASIGTYEFAGVTVLAAMGHPAEASLLAVALVHVIVTLPPALMGLAAMWLMHVRPVSLGRPPRHPHTAERAA